MPRDGEKTKRRILEVATTLFARYGFDKVTVLQISKRLRISEPAVYRYFDGKQALCDAVLDSITDSLAFDVLFDSLGKEDDVRRLLTGLATHIVTYFSRRPELYRLLLYSSLSGHARAHRVYHSIRGTYCGFFRRRLDQLYERGLILNADNEITARCFIGMVFDCALANTLWKGMQGKTYDSAKVIANNVRIYAGGLTGRAEDLEDNRP